MRFAFLVCLSLGAAWADDPLKLGHSKHGAAFDEGPRQKPWKMDGIGQANFPITTAQPEVQAWFNQGITLLHSFWYFEAERAFRWCLKLEPDNAMAWWGLARAMADDKRAADALREAVRRKNKVTERERLYIEIMAATGLEDKVAGLDEKARQRRQMQLLEDLILKYPGDLEAQVLHAWIGTNEAAARGILLKNVLAKAPDHVGAHHYVIHNWNHRNAEQALDSSARYAELTRGIGHGQHMPGHIYATVGMWHEAALSMDAATRVEARYMRDRLALPFHTWNYGHNRDYLCYIQEQLGMPGAALAGARELLSAPLDPDHNKSDGWTVQGRGKVALLRALVKYERWKELVDAKTFATWDKGPREKIYRAYGQAMGHLGLGDRDKAEKAYGEMLDLKKDLEKSDFAWWKTTHDIFLKEVKALLLLARGETLEGLALLSEAAEKQLNEQRDGANDPPSYPGVIYVRLGRAYLAQKSPALAAMSFEKALEVSRNDGFALAGLVEARRALGETDKARQAQARLNHVWSGADAEWRGKLDASIKPNGMTARPERDYQRTALEKFGPAHWEPYPAPKLDAVDAEGKPVRLEDYRGKNVLVIFYLGEECPHCLEQLVKLGQRKADLERNNTVVLAVSPAPPEKNKESKKMGDVPFRLVSDTKKENAKRFLSYDDFEEQELHSTILVDKQGRVHWARTGGDPFMNFDFLFAEIARLN